MCSKQNHQQRWDHSQAVLVLQVTVATILVCYGNAERSINPSKHTTEARRSSKSDVRGFISTARFPRRQKKITQHVIFLQSLIYMRD